MLSMMEILWYRLEDKLDFKRGGDVRDCRSGPWCRATQVHDPREEANDDEKQVERASKNIEQNSKLRLPSSSSVSPSNPHYVLYQSSFSSLQFM
jgi:hypothetical protein